MAVGALYAVNSMNRRLFFEQYSNANHSFVSGSLAHNLLEPACFLSVIKLVD